MVKLIEGNEDVRVNGSPALKGSLKKGKSSLKLQPTSATAPSSSVSPGLNGHGKTLKRPKKLRTKKSLGTGKSSSEDTHLSTAESSPVNKPINGHSSNTNGHASSSGDESSSKKSKKRKHKTSEGSSGTDSQIDSSVPINGLDDSEPAAKSKKKPKSAETEDEEDIPKRKKINKENETVEEKRARRKQERKDRQVLYRMNHPVTVTKLPKSEEKKFNKMWDTETKYITETLQVLPEVRRPHLYDDEEEKMEDFLLDEESAPKMEKKREKFLAKMRQGKEKDEQPTRALTHEELRKRLHAKIAALSQTPNVKKRERKLQKKARKVKEEEGSDAKKKFISKANPNLKNQHKGQNNQSIKDEKEDPSSSTGVPTVEKTPIRKKPVVKSNGEVVYSKFDFISGDKGTNNPLLREGKVKPKPEDLLKSVQKAESKIARLTTEGRPAEAVTLVETQKWDSALKRAQGEKIRDDPTLLKKTIKTQEKRKQVSKKKWQERTERVEKQKEQKQEKRKSNMQARKEEKVKKVKKQQRKQGRIV